MRRFEVISRPFLAELKQDGSGLPRCVLAEFERYRATAGAAFWYGSRLGPWTTSAERWTPCT
jgi:hypothetical protein